MVKSYITNKELLEAIEALEIAELLNNGNKLQLEYNDKTGELKVLRCFVKRVSFKKMEFEKLREAERKIEDFGYDFFYEVSDEEMEEDANANGILYLEDGTEYFD